MVLMTTHDLKHWASIRESVSRHFITAQKAWAIRRLIESKLILYFNIMCHLTILWQPISTKISPWDYCSQQYGHRNVGNPSVQSLCAQDWHGSWHCTQHSRSRLLLNRSPHIRHEHSLSVAGCCFFLGLVFIFRCFFAWFSLFVWWVLFVSWVWNSRHRIFVLWVLKKPFVMLQTTLNIFKRIVVYFEFYSCLFPGYNDNFSTLVQLMTWWRTADIITRTNDDPV